MKPPVLLLLAFLSLPTASHATASQTRDEIELGYSHDALDNGYADWSSTYLNASHRFRERQTLYGEMRQTRRFGLNDSEISAGYYHPLDSTWTGLVEASSSMTHHVLPRYSVLGQLQRSFDEGWNVQAGLRQTQYDATSTSLMVMAGERYWGNFRAAYKLYVGKPQGASAASSHNGQLSYYYDDLSYLTFNLTKGRQVENLGSNLGVLTTEVTSASLSGRHWLDPDWCVSYEAIVDHQGSFYSRKGFRLGLRRTF